MLADLIIVPQSETAPRLVSALVADTLAATNVRVVPPGALTTVVEGELEEILDAVRAIAVRLQREPGVQAQVEVRLRLAGAPPGDVPAAGWRSIGAHAD